jgi:hypothetical protein
MLLLPQMMLKIAFRSLVQTYILVHLPVQIHKNYAKTEFSNSTPSFNVKISEQI